MARIPVEVAADPGKCGGRLVAHGKLGGAVCARCGYYFDDRYLAALGLELPLLCGVARAAGVQN